MVDELEKRLTRYRADLDAAVAADLARRHLASREAGSHDADPFLLDTDHLIRLEPTMSAAHDRRRVMLVATLGVAAAVTTAGLIALVTSRDANDTTPAEQPSPTVTTPPQALPNSSSEQLVPGTYFVDEVQGSPTARIFVTFGSGWRVMLSGDRDGWNIHNESNGFMALHSGPDRVFSDAYHWEDGYHPGPVTTVEGVVVALSEQAGWADVTAPSDISVDGYVGKAFQRTAPADMSDCSTYVYATRTSDGRGTFPDFRSWENGAGGFGGSTIYEPGEIETLWVLDIDGNVVVIRTGLWPEPTGVAHADLHDRGVLHGHQAVGFADAVLESIRIARV